jgi:hypothetical protein
MVARTCARAALALVLLVALAPAARAETEVLLSPTGSHTLPSVGRLSFRAGVFQVRCEMTLKLEVNAGVDRTPVPIGGGSSSEIARVTEVAVGREGCEGGRVGAFLSQPWNVQLTSALGAPTDEATGILLTIVGFKISFSVIGEAVNCLYEGNVGLLVRLTDTGTDNDRAAEASLLSTSTLALRSGGGLCPSAGSFSGALAMGGPSLGLVWLGAHDIALECREGTNSGVWFGTVAAGTTTTETLRCTYVHGTATLFIQGSSGVVGGNSEAFRAEGIPAPTWPFELGDVAEITVRFSPPAGTPAGRIFTSNFQLVTTAANPRTVFTILLGKT